MSIQALGATIPYADFAQTWSYFQGVYTKQAEDTTNLLVTRRSFFRNGMLTIIAQVDHQPETRTPMLASLMDYVDLAGSCDGLEFLYLTLLNAANLDNDAAAFANALAVWQATAAGGPTVSGAGPMGFYDLTSRKMAIFNETEAAAVRNSSGLAFGTDIATHLLQHADVTIDDPYTFSNETTPEMRLARRAHLAKRMLIEREVTEKSVWEAGAVAVGSSILEAGAILAVIPSPDPGTKGAAAICGLVGATILEGVAIYDFVDKLSEFNSQTAPMDSTTTVTIPDGGLAMDPNGNMCISNPDVDSSSSWDTNASWP